MAECAMSVMVFLSENYASAARSFHVCSARCDDGALHDHDLRAACRQHPRATGYDDATVTHGTGRIQSLSRYRDVERSAGPRVARACPVSGEGEPRVELAVR